MEHTPLLLTFYCLIVASSGEPTLSSHNAMRALFETSAKSSCPSCVELKADVSEVELANLRVEFIKKQILKKLKLKEAPKVSHANKLPLPLMARAAQQNMARQTNPDQDLMDEDDFFGRTNQVILFPLEDEPTCSEHFELPATCFTFTLPKDIDMDDIATADLWTFKLRDFLDGDPNVNQTLTYSEVVHWGSKAREKVFDRHITKMSEGWIRLDVGKAVRSWLELHERTHTVKVTCETCGFPTPPVSLTSDQKPFLVINTETNTTKRRPKRNINCVPGISECCREKLYISFVDIGWSGWVLQPKGYEAYFCRGSCSNAVSLTVTGSGYSSVVRKLFQQEGKKIELVPCCTATHLSSMQIIYMETNETVTHKTLPNMVVDSCGCM